MALLMCSCCWFVSSILSSVLVSKELEYLEGSRKVYVGTTSLEAGLNRCGTTKIASSDVVPSRGSAFGV